MPDPTERLNAALEGRYSIERGLGEGRQVRNPRKPVNLQDVSVENR